MEIIVPPPSVQQLKDIQQAVLSFIRELQGILASDKEELLVIEHLVANAQIPSIILYEYIWNVIYPLRERIAARDSQYFFDHAVMFEGLEDKGEDVNRFHEIWKIADEETKLAIWEWFDYFLQIATDPR